jgi:hypothetical protein
MNDLEFGPCRHPDVNCVHSSNTTQFGTSESRHELVPIQTGDAQEARWKFSGMLWLTCESGRTLVFPDKLKRVIVSNKLFTIAEQFLVQNRWIKGKFHDQLLEICCAVIGQPCLECVSNRSCCGRVPCDVPVHYLR